MIKLAIQKMLARLGYRLVPHALDSRTVLEQLYNSEIKTVIDVGANVGTTCTVWLKQFPHAKIHAFEPMPEALLELRQLEMKAKGQLKVWDIAASDRSGHAVFHIHKDHSSSSSLLQTNENCSAVLPFTEQQKNINVRTDRIDAALAEQPIDDPVFIKLDVQGAELLVLKGAKNTLKSTQFVLCEVGVASLYKQQVSFIDLLIFMNTSGFSLCGIAEQFHLADGHVIYFDALFIRNKK